MASSSIDHPTPRTKRNVLIVGKTGAGKSTVGNQLLGLDDDVTDSRNDSGRPAPVEKFKVVSAPSGGTPEPDAKEGFFTHDGVEYQLNVIDTVGLFDIRVLKNKDIMKKTKAAIKRYADSLNLIIFVMRNGRVTNEELEAFNTVHKHFAKDIDPISLLVITGCEGKDRKNICDEYTRNEHTKKIVAHMGKGIIAVGFPCLTELEEDLQSFFKKGITKDRLELRKKVMDCNQSFLRSELYNESWCPIL